MAKILKTVEIYLAEGSDCKDCLFFGNCPEALDCDGGIWTTEKPKDE